MEPVARPSESPAQIVTYHDLPTWIILPQAILHAIEQAPNDGNGCQEAMSQACAVFRRPSTPKLDYT